MPKRLYEIAPEQVERDAAFMADARQDLPALLNEFDRLRALLHDVHTTLSDVSNGESADVCADLYRILSTVSELR